MNLIGLLSGIYYYTTDVNQWENLIHPHLPKFLFPSDKKVLLDFYEGLSNTQTIPWSFWIKPLSFWFLFIIAIYFLSICIMVLFRKQWSERERLIYPLTHLPTEMVSVEKPIYKNPIMWLGFSLPAILYTLNGLHNFFPGIPSFYIFKYLPIFRRTFYIPLNVFFEVIGLAFLVSLDVSFSLWFFALLAILLTGYMNIIGFSIGPVEPFSDPAPQAIAYQSLGALIVLSISCIWFARSHIKDVWRKSIGRTSKIDDSGEILSYRACVFGGTIAFIIATFFLYLTGLKLLPAIFFLLIGFIIFLGLTRIVAQAGLAYHRAPVIPAAVTLHTFGSNFLGSKGLISLGLTFSWATDIRTTVMASTCNGLKLADNFKITGRKLFWAIILSILITLFASAWCTLLLGYRYGGINLSSWQLSGLANFSINWVKEYIQYPVSFGKPQLFFTCLGGFLMILLIIARTRFFWWSISPIGLACGIPYPVYNTWFSVFIAWLIKFLIMRYGGIKIYNKIRPFFLGLILGTFVTGGIWLVIGYLTKTEGIRFTLA